MTLNVAFLVFFLGGLVVGRVTRKEVEGGSYEKDSAAFSILFAFAVFGFCGYVAAVGDFIEWLG